MISFGDGSFVRADAVRVRVGEMGLCSSTRSSGYATSASDGAGCKPADEGGGGIEEAKGFTLLSGLHQDSVTCVSHVGPSRPDLVASGSLDKHIIVNNWKTGAQEYSWKAHDKAVNKIVFGNTADLLFSCSRDLSIRSWKLGNKTPLSTMTGHSTNVVAIDVSSTNDALCSGARDTSVRVWDIATATQTFQAQRPRNLVTCITYLPNDPCFAQGAEDLAVRVWDPRSGALRVVQEFKGYTYFPLDIDVSDDGNYLVTSSKGFNSVGCELRVWDRRNGKQVEQFTGHKQDVVACRIVSSPASTSGLRMVTASKDMTVRVWHQGSNIPLCQHMEVASGMFTSLSTPAKRGSTVFGGSFGGGVFVYDIGDSGNITLVARTTPDQESRLGN